MSGPIALLCLINISVAKDCIRCSNVVVILSSFFFFQAEDGIRDYKVTGVQTCALPIYILDLTTIDAGAMGLDLKPVDIHAAVDSAILGLQDRIAEKAILLDVRTAAGKIGRASCRERV